MKQLKVLVITLLTTIGISACGSTEKSEMAKKIEANLVCEYYMPTGSRIKNKVCMTEEQKAKRDQIARAEINRAEKRIAMTCDC